MASAHEHWAALRSVGAAVIIAVLAVGLTLAVLNFPLA
jgi:hypothetical protein